MSRSTQRREPIRDRKWRIPVGRYKGFTIEEVMGIEPHYLVWFSDETQYELHSDLIDELETDSEKARELVWKQKITEPKS